MNNDSHSKPGRKPKQEPMETEVHMDEFKGETQVFPSEGMDILVSNTAQPEREYENEPVRFCSEEIQIQSDFNDPKNCRRIDKRRQSAKKTQTKISSFFSKGKANKIICQHGKKLSIDHRHSAKPEVVPVSIAEGTQNSRGQRESRNNGTQKLMTNIMNTITQEGNAIKGQAEIEGQKLRFDFKLNTQKKTPRSPDYHILASHDGIDFYHAGAAWKRVGKVCKDFFWVVFDVFGNTYEYNAFPLHIYDGLKVFTLKVPKLIVSK